MRCLIVDDEEMSRKVLQSLCGKISDLEVVAVCESAVEAMNVVNNEEIDLIFLDIEMPEVSGLDFLKSMPDLPQVIITSSKTDCAIDAFRFHVTDFVPKPLDVSRFIEAVAYARKLHAKKQTSGKEELYVKVDGKLVRVNLGDLVFAESIGDYVVLNTDKKEKIIVHSTLKNIDEKLANAKFLKVHRSFIVNLTKIVDIQETNLVVKDKVIPVSRAHKPVLMSRILTL